MIPDTLKVGMEFTHCDVPGVVKIIGLTEIRQHNTQTIVDFLMPDGRPRSDSLENLRMSLKVGGWDYKEKPLDAALSKLNLTESLCKHKNIKRDTWFSAKVFLTCVDCGKALN